MRATAFGAFKIPLDNFHLDRPLGLYTATNKPDEVKKRRAERARYPQGKSKAPQKK